MYKTTDICDICKYLNDYKFLITETIHWKVVLCENQEYLGRSYVTLKRHCPSLTKLTIEEWLDLKTVIIKLENVLKKAFNATSFNWTCMMNDAYKSKTPQPHVHWHLRPRYANNVTFSDITFIDPEFGHHYARAKDRILNLSEDKLNDITTQIKKFF